MPKEEWGVKRVCPTTGKRFYDLGRTPVVSPYTGEVVDIDLPSRTGRTMLAEKATPAKSAPESDLDTDEEVIEADEETDVDLGDDVLEDDEDEVSLDDIADMAGDDDDET